MAWANEVFWITRTSRAERVDARPGYPAAAAEAGAAAFPGRRERRKENDGRDTFPKPSNQAHSGRRPSKRGLDGHVGDVDFMRGL
jgi:hypothetical protein